QRAQPDRADPGPQAVPRAALGLLADHREPGAGRYRRRADPGRRLGPARARAARLGGLAARAARHRRRPDPGRRLRLVAGALPDARRGGGRPRPPPRPGGLLAASVLFLPAEDRRGPEGGRRREAGDLAPQPRHLARPHLVDAPRGYEAYSTSAVRSSPLWRRTAMRAVWRSSRWVGECAAR